MNINLKFLLCGAAVWLGCFPQSVTAHCAVTDCLQLGYTSLEKCDNGLKCPFGEYWACPAPKEEKAILGECTGYAKNCKIGQILNSDGTCSDYRVNGVEPVGVVAYIGTDNCGQALALETLKKDAIDGIAWSREKVDIPGLKNSDGTTDFDSCKNTQTVLDYSYKAYGDSASSYYPAFWNAHDYTPSSAPLTKGKWCLSAGGVLVNVYKNIDAINLGFTRIAAESFGGNHYLWSSSQYSSGEAMSWQFRWNSLTTTNKLTDRYHGVRFVIEF